MAAGDKNLQINIKTSADTSGIDQVKGKLGELGQTSQSTGQLVGNLGSLIGLSLGAGAIGVVSGIISKFSELGQQQVQNAQHIQDLTSKLTAQQGEWGALALSAGKFFDVVRIGLQMLPQIQALTSELHKLQTTQLDFGSKAFDFVTRQFSTIPGFGAQPFEAERQAMIKWLKDTRDNALVSDAAILKFSEDEVKAWQAMKDGLPVSERLAQINQQLVGLESKRAAIDPAKSQENQKSYVELMQQIATWDSRRLEAERELERLDRSGAREERAAVEQRITEIMRQQATIMQGIRQQQQLINADPFIGADAKSALLLNSYTQELRNLQLQLAALQNLKAGGLLDPAQLAQGRAKDSGDQFRDRSHGRKNGRPATAVRS